MSSLPFSVLLYIDTINKNLQISKPAKNTKCNDKNVRILVLNRYFLDIYKKKQDNMTVTFLKTLKNLTKHNNKTKSTKTKTHLKKLIKIS